MKSEREISECLKDIKEQQEDYEEKLREIDHREAHKDYAMLMKKWTECSYAVSWLEWVLK